jgi:hypothetical protein
MLLVSGNLFWWRSEGLYVTCYVHKMSKHAGTSMWITTHDPNFGEEMVGYLQEGMSDAESESECTIKSDYNTECTEAE